jgi:hypothetical protein
MRMGASLPQVMVKTLACSSLVARRSSLALEREGGGVAARPYATTTTMFPSFWPVSAYR